MELENAIFGNSRGEYLIERGEGFEEELYRLFEAYAPSRDNSWREYGVEFENDVFQVMPYWWGDCTCGAECPKHSGDCDIVTKWNDWIEARLDYCSGMPDENGFAEVNLDKFPEFEKRHPAPECTCAAEENWQEKEEHEQDCKLIAPNFLFKPTGFSIQWYKYPLRDSYMSQNVTLDEFRKIVSQCVESCTAFQQSVQPTGGYGGA